MYHENCRNYLRKEFDMVILVILLSVICVALFGTLIYTIFDYAENINFNNRIKFSYNNLLLFILNILKSKPQIRYEQTYIIISNTRQQIKITSYGVFIHLNIFGTSAFDFFPVSTEDRFIYPGFIDSLKFKFLFKKIIKSANRKLADKLTNSLLTNFNSNYDNLSSDEIANIILHYLPNISSDNNDHSFKENELTDNEPIGFKITNH